MPGGFAVILCEFANSVIARLGLAQLKRNAQICLDNSIRRNY